jgi:hypothetical protein
VLDGVEPTRASELGPSIVAERLEQTALTLVPAYRRAGPDTRLTERELEVLRVLAAGSTERDAAAALLRLRCTESVPGQPSTDRPGVSGLPPSHSHDLRK